MRGITATAIFKPRDDLGRFVESLVSPAVRMGVEESCALIETRAKELVPVDTGALRDSITTEITETGKRIVGTVAPHMSYAAYVCFGTGIRGASSPGAGPGPYSTTWPGMVARPFMRPSVDSSREEIKAIFSNDLQVGLK